MNILKGVESISYHIVVIVLSAAMALSLPYTITFIAQKSLIYWSYIENEKIFLVSVEISVAILLIIFLYYIRRGWRDRGLSQMARSAGFVLVTNNRGRLERRKIGKLKENEGSARDIKIMGSTGYRTFVDGDGDFHQVIRKCRSAKIMLLDPTKKGASMRANSFDSSDITPERFKEEIIKSIYFLKGLKTVQKKIRLKLYPDPPFMKLTIFGDYLCMRYYHTGLDVRDMPEYIFKYNQNPGDLYIPFYHYFLEKWHDSDIPEYDLDTDELIYRDKAGNEIKREQFTEITTISNNVEEKQDESGVVLHI
jgi:hypothetical protein